MRLHSHIRKFKILANSLFPRNPPSAIILGFGKAGQEHLRVARLHGTFKIIDVIDLDDRNKQFIEDLINSGREATDHGFVIDARPFSARMQNDVSEIAKQYFKSFTLLEEKPASIQNADFINYQRALHPHVSWITGRLSYQIVTNITTIETVGMRHITEEIINDLLPHTLSIIKRLLPSLELNAIEHDLVSNLTLINGKYKIIWITGQRNTSDFQIDTKSSSYHLNYPTMQFTKSASFRALNLSSLASLLFNIYSLTIRLFYYIRYDLSCLGQYDWFKFTHISVLQNKKHGLEELRSTIKFINTTAKRTKRLDKRYDYVMIGGSGELGSFLYDNIIKLEPQKKILIVSRSEIAFENCDTCTYEEFFSQEFEHVNSFIYLASPMGQDISRHHQHNDKLEKFLNRAKTIEYNKLIFLSSVAIQKTPNKANGELHSPSSSSKRSSYAYGKLIDFQTILKFKPEKFVELRGGLIQYQQPVDYGVKFSMFGKLIILSSPKTEIPITKAQEILDYVTQRRKELPSIMYISMQVRYPNAIFIPQKIAAFLILLGSPIYRRIKPIEDLKAKMLHFYDDAKQK